MDLLSSSGRSASVRTTSSVSRQGLPPIESGRHFAADVESPGKQPSVIIALEGEGQESVHDASYPTRPNFDELFERGHRSAAAYHRTLVSTLRNNSSAQRSFHRSVISQRPKNLSRDVVLRPVRSEHERQLARDLQARRTQAALISRSEMASALEVAAQYSYNTSLQGSRTPHDRSALVALRYTALGEDRARAAARWAEVVSTWFVVKMCCASFGRAVIRSRDVGAIRAAMEVLRVHFLPVVLLRIRSKRAAAIRVLTSFACVHVRPWLRNRAVDKIRILLQMSARTYKHTSALRLFMVRVRVAQRAARRWVWRRRLQLRILQLKWTAVEQLLIDRERAAELRMVRLKLQHMEAASMLALKANDPLRVKWHLQAHRGPVVPAAAEAAAVAVLRPDDSRAAWAELAVNGAAKMADPQLREALDGVCAHSFLPDHLTEECSRDGILRGLLVGRLRAYHNELALFPKVLAAWERRALLFGVSPVAKRQGRRPSSASLSLPLEDIAALQMDSVSLKAEALAGVDGSSPPQPPVWTLFPPIEDLEREVRKLRWQCVALKLDPNPYPLSQLCASHHSAHPEGGEDGSPGTFATFGAAVIQGMSAAQRRRKTVVGDVGASSSVTPPSTSDVGGGFSGATAPVVAAGPPRVRKRSTAV